MLKDKVAIITGASRGIGRATALAFARAGAEVVLAARTQHDLETVADLIRTEDGGALVVPTDVTQVEAVEILVNRTLGAYGRVDILVNNAGIGVFETVVDSDPEMWNQVVTSNLKSTYLCSKYVLPSMLERQSGHIINVLSVAAKIAFKASSAYCAAKAGALAFTKVLAEEVRGENIRVTAVSPGSVDTPFWKGIERHPDLNLMLKPEQVAETVCLVAMQPAGIVTDEIVVTPPLGIL